MAETYDFTSTMNLFFSDEPKAKECDDCESTEDLHILYTTEAGHSTWICKDCQEKRDAESKAREAAELAKVRAHEAFDEYEEPTY